MSMSNMPLLKTDKSLLKALNEQKSHRITAEEAIDQRVSYVYGSVKPSSSLTKEKIREMIEAQR